MIKKLGRPKINSLDIPAYRRTSPKDKMHYDSGAPLHSTPKSATWNGEAAKALAIDASVFLTPGGYPLVSCEQEGAYGFEVACLRVVNVKDGSVLLLQVRQRLILAFIHLLNIICFVFYVFYRTFFID
jgi:hypothetical protein